MGCWNHTCFLSNLSITCGEEMALMTLIQTEPEMGAYGAVEHYYPAPVMIYGEYDDYGGMEKCYGSEIDYLLKEFVDNHTLNDNISVEEFTRIGDQGGLYFSDVNVFHQKLKGNKNAGIPVQHIAIKLCVLNQLLDQYHFIDYQIKDSKDKYVPINYEFLCDLIPTYIKKLKKHVEKNENNDPIFNRLNWEPVPPIMWNDSDILGKLLQNFINDVGRDFYRDSFKNHLHTLVKNNNDEGLINILKEFCKYSIIGSYMSYSRRVFIRPQCSSQETNPIAQKLMAEITLDVIEQEKEKFSEDV